jgi:flavin-dependent dehydrogenase
VAERRSPVHDPAAVLRAAIDADPLLRERFAGARMIAPPAVMGPLAVDVSSPGLPGLLLAGDAAGFIDPMTGDGLRFAIRGAELAAHAALADPAVALRSLARARAEFASKRRFNRTLRWLVGSPAAVDLAALVARAFPGALRQIVAIAGDVSSR